MEPRSSPSGSKPPAIGVLTGQTASGKSELALAIARRLPIEILVADSRQVYRGMDIGTAKARAEDRMAVPHHLLDAADPDEPFTLADWLNRARATIPQVASRGRLPLVVGGSGLYISALVDGYDLDAQPWSPQLRRRLVEELEGEGLAALADRLCRAAPDVAATTDLRNPRRVLRALERLEAGGGGAGPAGPAPVPYAGDVAILGIARPRDVLQRRIDRRARDMFQGGLLDEVRSLLQAGYGSDLEPMTGHGYREAVNALAGQWPIDRAIEVTARHTRQYAKRQMTWFRRMRGLVWLDAGDDRADAPVLVARAVELLLRLQPG